MKCFHCGKTVSDEARFCKYCGTRLRRTCASCGAVLDDDALFCAACGAEAIAELDLANNLAELSAELNVSSSTGQNPYGFYFSRRISRQNRSAADNCFAFSGNRLVFVEDQRLNLLTKDQGIRRRYTDISRDTELKAVSLNAEGILAAGFDWGAGAEPTIMLWQYDEALNIRTAAEVLLLSAKAERRACKMRLTDRNLFIFLWESHEPGKREIVKYDLQTGKLEQNQIAGKRIDLWYVDGERIYFRGEREEECFFGVLDTAQETWTVYRLWTIGSGPEDVPEGPVYCDFEKRLAWTAATPGECRELGLADAAYVARELAPGHKLLKEYPAWQAPETGAVNLFLDYFDGVHSYKANNVLAMDACDPNGSKHRWKYTLHGDTENVILWGENLLADFTSHGYRIYPATQEGPADVYKDGVSVREM